MKKWIMLLIIVFMLAGCDSAEKPQHTGSARNEGAGQDSAVQPAKQNADDNQTHQKPDAGVQTVLVKEDQIRRGNLVLVNKEFKLDADAVPSDIVHLHDTPELLQGYALLDNSIRLSRQVAEHFNGMMEAAAKDGVVHFMLSSGYRDMEEQERLYREKGADYALPAGYSEHNLGLSMDIGSTQMPIDRSPEGRWLQKHAWKYGFILRYPKDKTEITGIQYEPWHFRYVGLPHSRIMEEKRFTLEEYLMFLKKEKEFSTTVEGQRYDIRYVPVAKGGTSIELPDHSPYELSGNNMDGVIVTVTRGGGGPIMKPWPKFTLIVLYGGYLYVLLKIILFKFGAVDASLLMKQLARAMQHPEMMQNRLEFANLTPFVTIKQNIHRISDLHHMINLLGNVVIFMPNGIFMGLLTKRKALGALIASFALSLALECSQLLFSMGSFDVDDLILNSFGGLLGYFGYWLMLQLFTDPSSNQGTVRASNRPAT